MDEQIKSGTKKKQDEMDEQIKSGTKKKQDQMDEQIKSGTKKKRQDQMDEQIKSGTKKKKKSNKKAGDDASKTSLPTSAEKELMNIVKGLRASEESATTSRDLDGEKTHRRSQASAASASTVHPRMTARSPSGILMTIAEAFDDDDVVEEFVEEKRRKVEDETEKDEDLFLPGWGGWTGPGIVQSKRIKLKYTKKANPKPRADNYIGHCIISEKPNTAVDKHQLMRLPQGFKSVEHLNSVLSKPLGREFNTAASFKQRVAPKVVVTRAGQILEPIGEDVLLKKANKISVATDIEIDSRQKSRKNVKPHTGKKRKRGISQLDVCVGEKRGNKSA